jgi:glycosyltransferase involved in cell wall biosynthesis
MAPRCGGSGAAGLGLMAGARRSARLALHTVAAIPALLAYAVLAPFARLLARRKERPSTLWGTTPIANLRNSVLADRLRGYESASLVYRVYRPSDRAAFDHVWEPLGNVPGLRQLAPYAAFLWAGLRFDVFCFYFDGGLLAETPFWRVELPLLRLAGKRIVVWPYGGDARLPSLVRARGGWNAYTDVPPGAEDRDESQVRARLDAFDRWADVVLGCADILEELPRLDGVLPYPFDEGRWQPAEAPDEGIVRVVHAPNHPHYKGTRYLEDAVRALREEGLPVDLVLVEGKPNEEARREYERADVVADQFLLGAYALFAIEGMALGKPVLCYLNPRFAPQHPEWQRCPIVNANPDTLQDELRRLVTDASLRRELGARGPAYVRDVHSLEAVGARLDEIYRRLWRRLSPA